MGQYLVSFTTDTPICIHDYRLTKGSKGLKIFRNEFQYTTTNIIVETYDNIVQHESTISRRGLRIDVELDSTDIVSSIGKAGGYADAVVSFLVLSTSSYAPVVKFDFAYEITPEIDKREYLRDFYMEEIESLTQRKVEPNIFGQIFETVSKHEDKVMQPISKKGWNLGTGLARAISWLRKGISTDDVIDEYIYYWVALEALNNLLPQKDSELPRKECAECQHIIDICHYCECDPKAFATTSPLYGVEQLAKDTGLPPREFRDLVTLRAKIFHGGATLRATREPEDEPLTESIRKKTPVVRNLVIEGLSKILQLPEETAQQIKEHQLLKEGQTLCLRLRACLQDFNVGRTSEGDYPIHPLVEVSRGKLKIESLPNDKFTVTGSGAFQPINCRWAKNTNIKVELWSNVPSIEQGKFLDSHLTHSPS